MPEIKGWLKENQALVIGLVAQAIVAGIYMVNLEARVSTLETRGSRHIEALTGRLTVTEKETENNNRRIDRIVDIMTKDLHIAPADLRVK